MSEAKKCLERLFKAHFKISPHNLEPLAQTGSYRQYYRIKSENEDILGVYNTDLQENKTYLSFTKTFSEADIRVPEVYKVSDDKQSYLIQDLGSKTLYECAQENRNADGSLSRKALGLYRDTLSELLKIQTKTIGKLDLSYCYPRDAFDKQSILWDLNYFKYFFLRLLRVAVDEQKLEDDIQKLADKLDKVDRNFFLYRDFQSKNIMIKYGMPYFIDFQGGRKGSIYYDVASLLFDANIELTKVNRDMLLKHYYKLWNEFKPCNEKTFKEEYYLFAIVRLVQALGAFGLRGVVERKPHFKECIPYALNSLKDIIIEYKIEKVYPTLCKALLDAEQSEFIKKTVVEGL